MSASKKKAAPEPVGAAPEAEGGTRSRRRPSPPPAAAAAQPAPEYSPRRVSKVATRRVAAPRPRTPPAAGPSPRRASGTSMPAEDAAQQHDPAVFRLLVGNEHRLGVKSAPDHPQLKGAHKHNVCVFVRAVPGQRPDPLTQILRVRFGTHQTVIGASEHVVSQPPFERRVVLWGYFETPITIEWKHSAAEPLTVNHLISFDAPLTQREYTVHRAESLRRGPALQLLDAVKLRDAASVRRLAPAASPAALDESIIHALFEHRIAVLEPLLAAAAAPQAGQARTPPPRVKQDEVAQLLKAAWTGNVAEMKAVLAKGVSVRSTDERGRQAQHLAAREDQLSVLKQLHKIKGGLSAARDADGYSVYHAGAERGNYQSLRLLLALGVDPALLNARTHAGPYGPGLTPKLVAQHACELYYPRRQQQTMQFFADVTIDWETSVLPVVTAADLSAEQKMERLQSLEKDGRALRWFDYCARSVSEGVGVTRWHAERAGLIYQNLLLPLLREAGAGTISNAGKRAAKGLLLVLRDVTGVVDDESGPGPLRGIIRSVALRLQRATEDVLNAAQEDLRLLPTATPSARTAHLVPDGWPEVPHLLLCHKPLEWLPGKELGVAAVYRSLLGHGIVGEGVDVLKWFDEAVLPTIDWQASGNERLRRGPAAYGGDVGATDDAVTATAAAIRLAAYDSVLLAIAQRRDAGFQKAVAAWARGRGIAERIRAGPLKTLARIGVKKLDYMHLPDVRVTGKRQHAPEVLCRMAESVDGDRLIGNAAGAGRICDISRCAIACESEEEMVAILADMKAWRLDQDRFQVLSVKNLHHESLTAADLSGGYRDIKCLVLYRQADDDSLFVHEVQLILNKWLEGKRTMHLLYDATR